MHPYGFPIYSLPKAQHYSYFIKVYISFQGDSYKVYLKIKATIKFFIQSMDFYLFNYCPITYFQRSQLLLFWFWFFLINIFINIQEVSCYFIICVVFYICSLSFPLCPIPVLIHLFQPQMYTACQRGLPIDISQLPLSHHSPPLKEFYQGQSRQP